MSERFGAYRVLSELTSSGVIRVYRAEHERLGRPAIIKALSSTVPVTSSFAVTIEREARVLAELKHPNILLLYDYVKSDEAMYMVVEYVPGFSVADVIARKVPLAPEAVAYIGAELASALEHAHSRGIVHRDVKPQNILLSKEGAVKLADFGIAQRERLPTGDEPLRPEMMRSPAAEGSTAFGTATYMSPEQILGEFVDARSDIFSLGVVLYELACGMRPFGGKAGEARGTRREPAVPLRTRAPEVPPGLEHAIMRALEKQPADRFPSAARFQGELEAVIKSQPKGRSRLVVSSLARARLLPSDPDEMANAARAANGRPTLSSSVLGFVAIFVFILLAGAAIQWTRGGATASSLTAAGGAPLALVPSQTGFLRVLATPWAMVSVDGQHFDITPFARAICLPPGTHYLTFTHPNAKPERRSVQIEPGRTLLVDVTMDVSGAVEKPKENSRPPTEGNR